MPSKRSIEYETYISSNKWSRKRKRLLGDHNVCLGCFRETEGGTLHLHHVNYDALGKETRKDVIPLCKVCHEALHSALKKHGWTAKESHKAWPELFGHPLASGNSWQNTHNVASSKKSLRDRHKDEERLRRRLWESKQLVKLSEPLRASDSPMLVIQKLNFRKAKHHAGARRKAGCRDSIGDGKLLMGSENGNADKPRVVTR